MEVSPTEATGNVAKVAVISPVATVALAVGVAEKFARVSVAIAGVATTALPAKADAGC